MTLDTRLDDKPAQKAFVPDEPPSPLPSVPGGGGGTVIGGGRISSLRGRNDVFSFCGGGESPSNAVEIRVRNGASVLVIWFSTRRGRSA